MNEIGIFANFFRTKINLYNGSRDKEEGIVNGMMFTHADVTMEIMMQNYLLVLHLVFYTNYIISAKTAESQILRFMCKLLQFHKNST